MKEILKKLSLESGISGNEKELFGILKELLGESAELSQMPNGNIIAVINKNAKYHIMLDAHIDRIGLVVTYIHESGFLKAEPVGGIDLRTLPSSAVIVKGKEKIHGIVCTMPPHLSHENNELDKNHIWVDTGLPYEKVKELISLGDSIIIKSFFRELLNQKIAVSALDNRAGCAILIQLAHLLKEKELPCKLSLVFSSQEETNESGARTAAFLLNPDEAIVIDVGFAKQDGVPEEKSGKIGCGGIISIAPVLSKKITNKLISIAKEFNIPCDYEVDGGNTGTNADGITITRGGIPCGVISIPEKNMHSQTEMLSLNDMQKITEILMHYILSGGVRND